MLTMPEHIRLTRNRREFLCDAFCGFGALAYAALLHQEEARAASINPLAPKRPHMPDKARARSVIFLFMAGGPSHIETFDPKPLLNKLSGQKRPESFGEAKYQFISPDAKLLGTRRVFKKYGKSGIEVSDLFPHTAECIDDIAVIRSCHGDMVVHSAAQYQLFTGRVIPGFPSMGSWVIYGLGSESESLPAYVVMPDPKGALEAGQPMYLNGFLPAVYQPTMFRTGKRPVLNLDLPEGVSLGERRKTLDLIRALDEANLAEDDTEFAARISAYDLAFKMQTENADRSARRLRSVERAAGDTGPLWSREDADRRLWASLPPCPQAGRERSAFCLPGFRRGAREHAMGRARGYRREPPEDGRSDGPAGGRAVERSQGARAAGDNARSVGRRVRALP